MINIYEIGDYYINKARELCHPSFTILKTDCFNEVHLKSILPHIRCNSLHCIETSAMRVAKSKRMYNANYVIGSITDMPYADKKFDLILDFSTMDHVADYKKAIAEYERTLADDGLVYIIVWLDCLNFSPGTMKHNALPRWDFIKELKKKFNIIHHRTILRRAFRKNISFVEFKLIKNIPENVDLK